MPYLGKTPASVALATSDLADSIVTEAKMADDAISIVELKAGTDGELISWDASGNPVAIGVGTSGHYLKSQGAGAQPVFASVSTSGAYDLNGAELTLDANANTSITADTDDQIDFEIAGADDFQMTANTFTILSGSTIAIAAGGAITNAGTMAPDISSTGKAMVLGF